jgi:hypothetical protein
MQMSSPFSFKFTAVAIGLLFLCACNPASQSTTSAPAPQTPAEILVSATLPPCPNNIAQTPGTCLFSTTGFYTSKEPYVPRQLPGSYTPAPEGFSVVAVQHAARHGSRALSSADDDDLMYQLWQQARQENALTPLGELLGPVIEDVIRVHAQVGYGNTSRLGEIEHEQTAARLIQRHPELFNRIIENQQRIDVYHSGRERADESGVAFARGLSTVLPALEELTDPGLASLETLYFNEAEGSETYQQYSDNDPRMMAAIEQIESHANTRAMARLMLEQIFTADFVQRLSEGAYQFAAAADPEDMLEDELDAAEALYGLYSIAVGLSEEADWQFGRFMHPQAVAWFAYVDDAGSFYDRGPGFNDEDVTYAGARALVADMIEGIDAFISGNRPYPLTVRFSHAQALMPLAAFLGIEGSREAADPAVLYTYDNNPWRSELVSPMAANVQWDVFQNQEGVTLVRMLHQEGEVRFAANCEPWQQSGFFVTLDELKRCYGF